MQTALLIVLAVLVLSYLYWRYRIFARALRLVHTTPDQTGEFWVGSKSKPEFSLLIMGDSIAAGTGIKELAESLGGRIAEALSERYHVHLVNRAQAGSWVSDMALDEIKGRWDLVIVVAGSNELIHGLDRSLFRRSLNALLRHLSKLSRRVVLVGPGNVAAAKILPFWVRFPLRFRQGDYAEIMRQTAAEHGVAYVDPLEYEIRETFFADDHLHPNARGHRMWFEITWAEVRAELDHQRRPAVESEPQTLGQRLLGEVAFWTHFAVVVFLFLSGLFLSLWWVLVVLAVHRIHLFLFDGCALTRLEQREHGIPRGMSYFQFAWQRFFGRRLSPGGAHLVYIVMAGGAIGISLVASATHFRLV